MSILQMSILTPVPSRNLSSIRVLTSSDQTNLISQISHLSIQTPIFSANSTVIRMGGGPRTFPGGVSKWQWKRMQAKKVKQLLKARLCRERQIYEMRKRAELKAAVTELEKPWELVERAPTLFSVKADEQLKVLADRFQRPGGFDLWSERDGPQLFQTADGLPSARFFPKGVVHSVKPYGRITGSAEVDEELSSSSYSDSVAKNGSRRSKKFSNRRSREVSDSQGENQVVDSSNSKNLIVSHSREKRVEIRGGLRNKANRQNIGSRNSCKLESEQDTFETERREKITLPRGGRYGGSAGQYKTRRVSSKARVSPAGQVYDMNLKGDGSYEFQTNREKYDMNVGSEDAFELDSY